MDIFDVAKLTGVSVRNLKKVEKHGLLKIKKPNNDVLAKARHNLRRGNALTAEQLAYFIRFPDWLDRLDSPYEANARAVIETLGDVTGEAMPWEVSAGLPFAVNGEEDSLGPIVTWLRTLIDTSPAFAAGRMRGHAYMAVRVLAGIPEQHLESNAPLISKLFWKIRTRSKDFAEYWFVDENKRTQYRRPVALDL